MEFLPDLSQPFLFLIVTIALLAILLVRYFLVAGAFYLFFYKWYREKWSPLKISARDYPSNQFRKEVKWSIYTSIIFAIVATATLWLWQQGYTKIYLDWNEYGILYLPLSLIISLLIHELYYYWVHRWMHLPRIFKIVHKVHHDSNITSPWTAFSFHPLEGLLQALVLPIILIFIPLHWSIILIQLVIMSISSVINHLDIEIYPEKFRQHPLGKLLIGAGHHAQHHKKFKYNFGLYFTFLDKIHKTERS